MTLPAQLPTEWAHLPNAVHIDQVLTSIAAHPEKWTAAWAAIQDKARTAAWDAIQDKARTEAQIAAQTAAWPAAWAAIQDKARTAAWDAISALVAWDNCAKYLTMTPDQIAVWSLLSSDPAGVLLQPYVRVLAAVATKQQVDNISKSCYN